MADNTIVLNGNYAPFVEDEADAGEADIYPGNTLEGDGAGGVIKTSTEAASGRGLFADVSRSDPSLDKDDPYPDGDRVSVQYVPIGGKVDARLAAGGDLTTAANANVSADDLLVETNVGALAAHDSAETSGDPEGAVYRALEGVDNSGAAAGVENQAEIEVVRIA